MADDVNKPNDPNKPVRNKITPINDDELGDFKPPPAFTAPENNLDAPKTDADAPKPEVGASEPAASADAVAQDAAKEQELAAAKEQDTANDLTGQKPDVDDQKQKQDADDEKLRAFMQKVVNGQTTTNIQDNAPESTASSGMKEQDSLEESVGRWHAIAQRFIRTQNNSAEFTASRSMSEREADNQRFLASMQEILRMQAPQGQIVTNIRDNTLESTASSSMKEQEESLEKAVDRWHAIAQRFIRTQNNAPESTASSGMKEQESGERWRAITQEFIRTQDNSAEFVASRSMSELEADDQRLLASAQEILKMQAPQGQIVTNIQDNAPESTASSGMKEQESLEESVGRWRAIAQRFIRTQNNAAEFTASRSMSEQEADDQRLLASIREILKDDSKAQFAQKQELIKGQTPQERATEDQRLRAVMLEVLKEQAVQGQIVTNTQGSAAEGTAPYLSLKWLFGIWGPLY